MYMYRMQVSIILESCLFIYMYMYRMQVGDILESCLFIYMHMYRMQVGIILGSCSFIFDRCRAYVPVVLCLNQKTAQLVIS